MVVKCEAERRFAVGASVRCAQVPPFLSVTARQAGARTRVTRPSPSISWASKNGFAQIESSSVMEPVGSVFKARFSERVAGTEPVCVPPRRERLDFRQLARALTGRVAARASGGSAEQAGG